MGKSRQSRKKSSKIGKSITHSATITNEPILNPPPDLTKKSVWIWSKFWTIFTGFLVIMGGVVLFPDVRDLFLSSKKIHDRDNFEEGDLRPMQLTPNTNDSLSYSLSERPPVFYSYPIIIDSFPKIKGILLRNNPPSAGLFATVGVSLVMLSFEQLIEGIKLEMTSSKNCVSSVIYLLMKDWRLYISAEFKDLQSEQHIGIIEYNHWRLYKPNLLEWQNDDERLEVRDKQHNIVCSISSKGNSLVIAGYYINPYSISILGNDSGKKIDTCFSKSETNWKVKAETQISTIKSIFP